MKVTTWIIEDDEGAAVTERLSAQERELPIAVIWNHQFLIDRVAEGWRPEMEGRDHTDNHGVALAPLLESSTPGAMHVVWHYLYFPARSAAVEAAVRLRALGFKTEELLGADGTNWLVLARHEVIPTERMVSETRQVMESLVRSADGEYDGWEAQVLH